jgi:uncharacterized protein (TIGR03437 family)
MFLLLLAIPARAQFAELAATDDGKQLFFTSQLILKGAEPSAWPETRLYRFGSKVDVFAERGSLAPEGTFGSGMGVTHPSVSGDGSVVGFTFNGVCRSTTNCSEVTNRAAVRGRETLDLGPGVVQISRNGRWAVVLNEDYDYAPLFVFVTSTLIDLLTGQRVDVPSPPYVLGQWSALTLASDGSLLVRRPDAVVGGVTVPVYELWKQRQITPVSLPSGEVWTPFALTDDAGTILCYGYPADPRGLWSKIVAISVASGKTTSVIDTKESGQTPIFMAASNDGRRVLYRVPAVGQLNGPSFVWDSATVAAIPVPLETGELATAGTLSGDGSAAFFPQTPYCDDPGPLAGGSLARLHCPVFDSMTAAADQILYDGEPAPLIYSRPGETGVQIPWQWFNFAQPILSLRVASDSPFQPSQPLNVWEGAPAILPADPGQSSLFGIKIVKGDWSGLLNSQPLPGDVVYIYMIGLGWPQAPETTGIAASLAEPNPIQWKLSCRFLPQQQPAELLFAGLAPGTLGIYQTAFRIPPGTRTTPFTGIECNLASPSMIVVFGPGIPIRGIASNVASFPASFRTPSKRRGPPVQ